MDKNIERLRYFQSGEFPAHEIWEVWKNLDFYTPVLLKELDRSEHDWKELLTTDPEYQLHMVALVILAFNHEPRLLKPLVNLCSVPQFLFRDPMLRLLENDLYMFLAWVAKGDTSGICDILENKDCPRRYRVQACRALLSMLIEGSVKRKWLSEYFITLFDKFIKDEPDFLAADYFYLMLVFNDSDILKKYMIAVRKGKIKNLPYSNARIKKVLYRDSDYLLSTLRIDQEHDYAVNVEEFLYLYHYVSQIDPEAVIHSMADDNEYFELPCIELEAISCNIQRFIPQLLDILDKNNAEWTALINSPFTDFKPIYALYLLATTREKKAYPLIYRFCLLPDELVEKYLNDILTEDLPNILAGVACGDTSYICRIIENDTINQWVRSAAVTSLLIMLLNGDCEELWLIRYFLELFTTKLVKKRNVVWNSLVYVSSVIHADELYDEIIAAFSHPGPDPQSMNIEDVQRDFNRSREEAFADLKKKRTLNLITDPVGRLKLFFDYSMDYPKNFDDIDDDDSDFDERFEGLSGEIDSIHDYTEAFLRKPQKGDEYTWDERPEEHSLDIQNKTVKKSIKGLPKIGRNAPCPCGSGKKYKKCCLNK